MIHDRLLKFASAFVPVMCAGALLACAGEKPEPAAAAQPASIIPAPAEVVFAKGAFTLSATTPVVATSDAAPVARYFIALVQKTKGPVLKVSDTGERAIRFALVDTPMRDEGYALEVKPEGITVRANDARGLFYGAISLWQLLTAAPAVDGNW